MMKLIKGILLIVIGLAILGAFVENSDQKSKAPVLGAVSTAPSKPAKITNPVKYTARQIEAALNNNEIAVQKKVSDAGGAIVTGRVQSVETVWGSPVIHFYGENPYIHVSAFLSRSDKDAAAGINRGDTISVTCQTPKVVVGAALYDCTLGR